MDSDHGRAARAARAGLLLAVVIAWLQAAQVETARACPDCTVGRVARAQAWGEDLALNLCAALAPFAVAAAASFWANRVGRL